MLQYIVLVSRLNTHSSGRTAPGLVMRNACIGVVVTIARFRAYTEDVFSQW
ncbi:hypothetical protein ACQB60_35160 [Actinomycetota bacterium Odt1-20B]